MNKSLVTNVVRLSLFAVLTTAGACVQQPVAFTLDDNLGQLEVIACEEEQATGVLTFDPGGFMINSGTFEIDIQTLTVTETGGSGKIGVTLGAGCPSTLNVTLRVAAPDALDTVCDSADSYGPYEITLDDNLNPVSISPTSITLSQATRGLLNEGEFSLCLQVVSPVTGTVDVQQLILNVGL